MFNGIASLLSWPGTGRSTTGSVDIDLERGDGSRSLIDDDRLSSVSSFRAVDSYASSTAEVNEERALPDLPQDELDIDNDPSTSGCGVGPSSEESLSATVPGFLPIIGRSASTPPETLRTNPPPDSTLQDQDRVSSAASSSSNHSYARFFHRSRTPKRTRSTRSLGPGGIHCGGLSVLSPIYEPSNPDLKDLAAMQKEGETARSSSPQKKMQAPSIHSTTSAIQERIMNSQATHPAFLKRQLKRTLSQTSSSSLHSEASGAPQLPTLHFRPAFTGISVGALTSPTTPSPGLPGGYRTPQPPTIVVPTRPSLSTTSPQRSQLSHSQPNTPQSLTTPRSHRFGLVDHSQKCSAIYEDSASEKSFVTATSGETEPGSGIVTKHDLPSTAMLVIYPQDGERIEQELQYTGERERLVQEQPSSSNVVVSVPEQPQTEQHQSKRFSESETTFNVSSEHHDKLPSMAPAFLQRHRATGTASIMSMGSTTVKNESLAADDGVVEETATIVEDERFIMERWMKPLFYSASTGKEPFSAAKEGEQKQYRVSSTCVLFWVGFVAPWCWLVGGWMPPREASLHKKEVKEKLKKVSMDVDRETFSQGEDGGGLKKWILPDPSSNFKATARGPFTSSAVTLCPKEVEDARMAVADPWVRRCRIASIVGGAILGLGLAGMVIVLTVVMD